MKAKLNNATLTLMGAIVGVALLHYFSAPAPMADDVLASKTRADLATAYVGLQMVESFDFEQKLKPYLERYLEVPSVTGQELEAIAVIMGLENQKEHLKKVLAHEKGVTNKDIVSYAFGLQEQLPPDWESRLAADYFGAQLKVVILNRRDDTKAKAEANFQLRIYEGNARRVLSAQSFFRIFQLLGMGLLISFYISGRHFRRLGRTFFPLQPLFVMKDRLFQFLAALLLGYTLIYYLVVPQLDLPFWMEKVVVTLLQMGLGMFLLVKMMFPKNKQKIAQVLGLDNLVMRPRNAFQILGCTAIMFACMGYMASLKLMGWPSGPGVEQFASLEHNPLAAGLFLLVVCIAMATFEEVVFRGLIFRGFLGMMRPWRAIFLNASLFAIIHPLTDWPIAFGVGLALAISYYRSTSLLVNIWASALVRCLHLLMGLMGIALFSGTL